MPPVRRESAIAEEENWNGKECTRLYLKTKIVGATGNPRKYGFQFVNYVKGHGFKGKIYLINPKGGEVLGLKMYPDFDSINGAVDLAVILTAAHTVPQVIQQCAKKGVKGVIVISAGFSEAGEDGKRLEEEIVRIARSNGIRIVGPNCLGVANLEIGLNATACAVVPKPKGSLGFISQSGSSLELLFSLSEERGIYFNKVVSSGNEADLTLVDYFDYFSQDPDINVIMMYVEGIDEKDGRRFIEVAQETTSRKPVVVLKVGRTSVGEKAISTHTGAMVGKVESYRAVFRQCGIIEAHTFEELFDYGLAFSSKRVPMGDRVAIIGPGGPIISTADILAEEGLHIPEFSSKTIESFKRIVPSYMVGLRNPLDITPSIPMDEREQVYSTVLEDEGTDGAIILTSALFYMKRFSEIIPRVYSKSSKPVFVGSIMSMVLPEIHDAAKTLGKAGIPCFPSPERAAKAYATLARYSRYLKNLKERKQEERQMDIKALLDELMKADAEIVSETKSKEILESIGIPTTGGVVVNSETEALEAAEKIGYPVVLKIYSPDISHKSDVGGVRTNLGNEQMVSDAFRAMLETVKGSRPSASIEGVVVQRMAPAGVEMIIGTTMDETFGPVLMFGMGGVLAELIKDVSFRIIPIRRWDAETMIREVKGFPLLDGYRGSEKVDLESLVAALMNVSELVWRQPEIKEMDINPVFATRSGIVAADARMVLKN